jgi:peptide/nickel transport system substrate-binding protein/oligopeptide transport system substrate-binding protein
MRFNRLISGIVVMAVLSVVPLLAQTKDGQPKKAQSNNDTFVVNFLPSQIELNPIKSYSSTEAQLFSAIYEGLVTYNPLTMKPVPGVASYWDISPDGKTYTFHLRENARYWNGDQVTAADFRNSWLTLLKPENHSPYSFLLDAVVGAKEYRTGKDSDPKSVGIRALSPSVLEVDLTHPAPEFLDILCHHSFVPVNPHMLNYSDWSKLPSVIGNGAYYIVKKSDTEIDLEKNELYWGAVNVHIPRIKITFRDNPEAVTKDFNAGQIQWIAGGVALNAVTNRDAVVVNPLFATTYFFFKANNPPWSDPRVRTALVELLPLAELRSNQLQVIPATTLVPPIPYYPEVKGITKQNRENAMKLLAEAGYPGGKGLPEIVIHVPDGADSTGVTQIMTKSWHDALGVDVKTTTEPYQKYVDNLSTADYTLATLTWIGDFADPLTFLQMWTTDSNLNDAHFNDSDFNSIVRTSLTETGTTRYATLSKAEERLLGSGEVIPLSHSPAINIIDLNQIDGWYPNPLDIHPFKYLQFVAKKPLKGVVKATTDRPAATLVEARTGP